jgi:hypothetical protein
MEAHGITDVPGADGWRYDAFTHDEASGLVQIPLVRGSDGKRAVFALPDFVNDPDSIATVARVVADAVERWEAVEGLGA